MDEKYKKLINERGEELSVFGFNIDTTNGVNLDSHFLGYSDAELAEMIVRQRMNGNVNIHSRFSVKDLLNKIDPEEIYSFFNIPKKPNNEIVPETPLSSFIYRLMLLSDKLIEDKRDRASLKRIINKYQKNILPTSKTEQRMTVNDVLNNEKSL